MIIRCEKCGGFAGKDTKEYCATCGKLLCEYCQYASSDPKRMLVYCADHHDSLLDKQVKVKQPPKKKATVEKATQLSLPLAE